MQHTGNRGASVLQQKQFYHAEPMKQALSARVSSCEKW
jgi:hypothetical protein